MSGLFGKSPKVPYVQQKPIRISGKSPIWARDDTLRRLAKVRRATVVSELSNPNIKRKQLGAGA